MRTSSSELVSSHSVLRAVSPYCIVLSPPLEHSVQPYALGTHRYSGCFCFRAQLASFSLLGVNVINDTNV